MLKLRLRFYDFQFIFILDLPTNRQQFQNVRSRGPEYNNRSARDVLLGFKLSRVSTFELRASKLQQHNTNPSSSQDAACLSTLETVQISTASYMPADTD